MSKNIYLGLVALIYTVYFSLMLNGRLKRLSKWSKYHFTPISNVNGKKKYNKNDCSDFVSYKCIGSGAITWKFMKSNIYNISLRITSIYYPQIYPFVFVNNSKEVMEHLLRGFHEFTTIDLILKIFHIICFLLDIYFLFIKKQINNSMF